MNNIFYKAITALIFSILFLLVFWPLGLVNRIIFDPLYLQKNKRLHSYFRYYKRLQEVDVNMKKSELNQHNSYKTIEAK